jgi:hypothetical protein
MESAAFLTAALFLVQLPRVIPERIGEAGETP